MKRKFLITAVIAAAAMMVLTACSSLKKENTQEPGGGDSAGTQTVTGTVSVQDSAGQSTAEIKDSGVTQDPVSGEEPAGEIIPDEDANAAENDVSGANDMDVSDGWTGSYAGDDESVSIALLDEATISFSFAQSGISGTAAVNGMQAVYNGDDHYVVVFNMNGDVLDVSVSNEEDYDASESPLNGTYVKE